MDELPCAVCGKELEAAIGDRGPVNQPSGATVFMTHGHYGSTVFDPMNKQLHLEIVICDACLREAATKDKIYLVSSLPVNRNYVKWVPPDV